MLTDFFDIVTGVFQGDSFVPDAFIISLNYLLQTSIDLIKENGFTLKKIRWYPEETKTDSDYADNLALLANKSSRAKFLQQSLEQVAGSICL